MTKETLSEAMNYVLDDECKEFVIRTTSGTEYIGTAYDAKSYLEDIRTEPVYLKAGIALYKHEDGIVFIDTDKIESINARKPEVYNEEP